MATLTRLDETLEIPDRLPVIALRDLVFFPYMVLPLLIGRARSVAALQEAEEADGWALLLAQKQAAVDSPERHDLYRMGTVIRVVQISHLADGTARVVMEGICRASVRRFLPAQDRFRATVDVLPLTSGDPELETLRAPVESMFREYARLHPRVPEEVTRALDGEPRADRVAHLISGHLLINTAEKQELLEAPDDARRFEILRELLVREVEILRIEEKLDQQIRFQMETGRRQGYLEDHLRASPREPADPEWAELEETINGTALPDHARDRVAKEFDRLRKLNPVAPEASVIRSYLDWILALPWQAQSADNLDVSHATQVLEAEHYGLTEVKERILDHIAVLSLVGHLRGPILCLVGPPGVGKTSLGRSIARCLDREFVRISLGGIRDEAEIRGHRRTYVGALPGRVIQGMRKSGTRNPVFLLDELDKLARDFHGDPGAALLEVLDPEQNRSFTDHYLELEFDLSNVLFLATANTLGEIPGPLRDRMEVIRLPGYLDTEKRTIARQFLWPKQTIGHGLGDLSIEITDEAIQTVIGDYTREAGVRELERRLSRVARKVARQVGTGQPHLEVVEPGHLSDLLGPPVHLHQRKGHAEDRAGIACGLAWTAAGGEVLDVEVAVVPGTGKIQLTGTLGDVMKESAFAALTYARSRAAWLGLAETFHQDVDIHIHIPEGATPKDGPSAGITIAVALISALTDTPARGGVAMTGEITLRGRVLTVGGIKEKAVAALRSGMHTVLLPVTNEGDISLLPEEVRSGVDLIPVETMDEVLKEALVRAPYLEPRGAGTRRVDDPAAPHSNVGIQVS